MTCTCLSYVQYSSASPIFGLRINPLKCEFGALSIEFLWHLINKDGIAPLPEKVAAMRSYEMPRTAKELRRYFAMINFYRRFVPKSAETLQPLYDLIKELNTQPKNNILGRAATGIRQI